jgi:hypothetical protein
VETSYHHFLFFTFRGSHEKSVIRSMVRIVKLLANVFEMQTNHRCYASIVLGIYRGVEFLGFQERTCRTKR